MPGATASSHPGLHLQRRQQYTLTGIRLLRTASPFHLTSRISHSIPGGGWNFPSVSNLLFIK